MRALVPTLLLALFLPLRALLTEQGLPNGYTVAPSGRDYICFRPPRPRSARKRSPRTRSSSYSRRRRQTPSETSPFHTLRNSACPTGTYTPTLFTTPTTSVAIRSVTSSQLSAIFAAAAAPPLSAAPDPVVVLFHGGARCPWTPSIIPAWAAAHRAFRTLCLVAIDARADPMLNYNLMVLGFPTVMRIHADRSTDTFRGNRTTAHLLAWLHRSTGVAPMAAKVPDHVWLGQPRSTVRFGEVQDGHSVNWPLVGANIVSVINVIWFAWRAFVALSSRFAEKHIGSDDDHALDTSLVEGESDGAAG